MFPGPDKLCARGPEGRFVHELVIPFVRCRPPTPKLHPPVEVKDEIRRRFPPGSEWLYVKLYTGTSTADLVLHDVVRPVTQEALRCGAAERWFFIRYGDPDWHLRLRFQGVPQRLQGEVLPALERALSPLLEDGRVWRVQLDTYEREVTRYGGPHGIKVAERIFHLDSETALDLIEMYPGDEGADARWRLCLRGIDLLLTSFGLRLAEKRVLLGQLREDFAREFKVKKEHRIPLGEKFRKERASLEALLNHPPENQDNPLGPGLAVLDRHAARLAPLIEELGRLKEKGLLHQPLDALGSSYVHMHVNRLLRSAHRAQELVLYDFLERLYEPRAARAS